MFKIALLVVFLGSTYCGYASAEDITQNTKRKAVYSYFEHNPSLKDSPAIDIYGDTYWDNVNDLFEYGKRGFYNAFKFQFGNGKKQGGYFGPQVRGSRPEYQQILFSTWDANRYPESDWAPAIPFLSEDVKDCNTISSNDIPGTACCKRNCQDGKCDGNIKGSGTKCSLLIPVKEGQQIRTRARRIATDQTVEYSGQNWHGDVWEVTVEDMENGQHWIVGRQLLADTYTGMTKMTNFREWLGRTPCQAFDFSMRTGGPWVYQTDEGIEKTILVKATSTYTNALPDYTCLDHSISSDENGITIYEASGEEMLATGDGTWDKVLYECDGPTDCAADVPALKPCDECKGHMGCVGAKGYCCNGLGDSCIKGRQGRGGFYCTGRKNDDYGDSCARKYDL